MKTFTISVLIGFSCLSSVGHAATISERFIGFFKAAKGNVMSAFDMRSQVIRKIYASNNYDIKNYENLEKQTVVMSFWDAKLRAEVFVVSPQGSRDFFELKNPSYIRSNADSETKHIVGAFFVNTPDGVKEKHVNIFATSDSLRLTVGDHAEEVQLVLGRLLPDAENDIKANLNSKHLRETNAVLHTGRTYKINGINYIELQRKSLRSRLYVVDDKTGTLVKSDMETVLDRTFVTTFILNGNEVFTYKDGKTSSADYNVRELGQAEMAEALKFKSFDLKTLVETSISNYSFNPDFYIKAADKTLFITLLDFERRLGGPAGDVLITEVIGSQVSQRMASTRERREVRFKPLERYTVYEIEDTSSSEPLRIKVDEMENRITLLSGFKNQSAKVGVMYDQKFVDAIPDFRKANHYYTQHVQLKQAVNPMYRHSCRVLMSISGL